MNRKGILTVVSGPSGAGKGTICKELLKNNENIKLSVSATTRAPREGEKEGVNYYYKTHEEFKKMIEEGDLFEYAERYHTLFDQNLLLFVILVFQQPCLRTLVLV